MTIMVTNLRFYITITISLNNCYSKIKDGQRLYNQNVIIFDDVITSGNTIMTCAKVISSYQPKTISIIVMASNQLDKLFK